MQIIVDIVIGFLAFTFGFVHNYALGIILATIIIKIIFYPLTFQSSKQMAALQRLQPIIKNVQERFKDNPKRLQEEMLSVYRTERVSPFGGCLPLLAQIPVFIGLFIALRSQKFTDMVLKSGSGGGFLWITDISKPDHTLVLVILIAATTFWMQKTSPAAQQNQMMNLFLPGFIAVMSVPFPAGLQIYWIVSNVITALQQLYIFRKLGIPLNVTSPVKVQTVE